MLLRQWQLQELKNEGSAMNMLRKLVRMITILLLVFVFTIYEDTVASADVPYKTYTYNFWLERVESPHPYIPDAELNGIDLGVGKLDTPNDLFIAENGDIYIVDTKNNRIVYFDKNLQYIDEIKTFNGEDEFNLPSGIHVTKEYDKYIADTENNRVVQFDKDNKFVREIVPETTLITETTGFRPTKVSVDEAGRIYMLAIGVNSGIIEVNPDGTFQGFMGATEVSMNPFTYFWTRYLASDEQIKRMKSVIPTEYNNIFLDENEFLYVTLGNIKAQDQGKDIIRRLNPAGKNILRDFGYGKPIGDYFFGGMDKVTKFNDVSVNEYQVYSALDSENGKIFTYDYDGNLLYAFGENGNKLGNFSNAVSLGQYEDKLYVLDNLKNALIIFDRTTYGKAMNDALASHYEGDYKKSTEKWEEVLKLNANSDVAYIGLGKVYLRDEEYKKAMDYFKLANTREYYSKAFTNYRREVMGEYFGIMMTSLLVLIFLLVIANKVLKSRKANRKLRGGEVNEPLS